MYSTMFGHVDHQSGSIYDDSHREPIDFTPWLLFREYAIRNATMIQLKLKTFFGNQINVNRIFQEFNWKKSFNYRLNCVNIEENRTKIYSIKYNRKLKFFDRKLHLRLSEK